MLSCVIVKCVPIVPVIVSLSLSRDALISMNKSPVGFLPESASILWWSFLFRESVRELLSIWIESTSSSGYEYGARAQPQFLKLLAFANVACNDLIFLSGKLYDFLATIVLFSFQNLHFFWLLFKGYPSSQWYPYLNGSCLKWPVEQNDFVDEQWLMYYFKWDKSFPNKFSLDFVKFVLFVRSWWTVH